jgi:hypothetical protein
MDASKIATMSLLLAGLMAAQTAVGAETPPAVKLPLVVWDINFNENSLDAPPPPLTKEQIEAEAKLTVWERLPISRCGNMDYVTKNNRVTVVQEAAGLKDKPLLLAYTDASSGWGPRVWINVPFEVARQGTVWTLTFDVAKGNVFKSGGVIGLSWGTFGLNFYEDGTVKAGTVEVARYAANKPLHFEFRIDVTAKTVAITVDGNTARTVTLPWGNQKAQFFSGITINGVLPGGFGGAPGLIAFDNIKLVMEK